MFQHHALSSYALTCALLSSVPPYFCTAVNTPCQAFVVASCTERRDATLHHTLACHAASMRPGAPVDSKEADPAAAGPAAADPAAADPAAAGPAAAGPAAAGASPSAAEASGAEAVVAAAEPPLAAASASPSAAEASSGAEALVVAAEEPPLAAAAAGAAAAAEAGEAAAGAVVGAAAGEQPPAAAASLSPFAAEAAAEEEEEAAGSARTAATGSPAGEAGPEAWTPPGPRTALGKRQMGSARMGSLQNSCFLTEGTSWVSPSTYFCIPRSARAYLFPQSVKIITFVAAPFVYICIYLYIFVYII